MKIKLASLLVILTVAPFAFGAAGYAAAPRERPTIAFFYVDDLNAGPFERDAIKEETVAKFSEEYGTAYSLRFGDSYRRKFTISRFTDLQNLDRFDLLPRLETDKVDYAVFYDVLPQSTKKGGLLGLPETESHLHVRVFDLKKNAYVTDDKFAYTSKWAWLSGHCEKLFADADSQVFKTLFPVKT